MVSNWRIENTHTTFNKLNEGQFFCMSLEFGNSIFLKLSEIVNSELYGDAYNAVNLLGELYWFEENDLVFSISVPFGHTVIQEV